MTTQLQRLNEIARRVRTGRPPAALRALSDPRFDENGVRRPLRLSELGAVIDTAAREGADGSDAEGERIVDAEAEGFARVMEQIAAKERAADEAIRRELERE